MIERKRGLLHKHMSMMFVASCWCLLEQGYSSDGYPRSYCPSYNDRSTRVSSFVLHCESSKGRIVAIWNLTACSSVTSPGPSAVYRVPPQEHQ